MHKSLPLLGSPRSPPHLLSQVLPIHALSNCTHTHFPDIFLHEATTPFFPVTPSPFRRPRLLCSKEAANSPFPSHRPIPSFQPPQLSSLSTGASIQKIKACGKDELEKTPLLNPPPSHSPKRH
ncbi:UNVERIFIED_CONTAM: hypothetical protein K2H54_035946 [Gekko kuhli]